MFPPTFPFHRPAIAPRVAVVEKAPASPPEVAAIATDCLLGVCVSNAVSTDPDGGSSKVVGGKRSGWRKTEYLFKLGRFIPLHDSWQVLQG